MIRFLVLALAAVALSACQKPTAKSCAQNSECPTNSICVEGICQRGVPSGGATSVVSGSGHLTSGTLTLDAVVGQPVAPAGSAGGLTLKPAEPTR